MTEDEAKTAESALRAMYRAISIRNGNSPETAAAVTRGRFIGAAETADMAAALAAVAPVMVERGRQVERDGVVAFIRKMSGHPREALERHPPRGEVWVLHRIADAIAAGAHDTSNQSEPNQ